MPFQRPLRDVMRQVMRQVMRHALGAPSRAQKRCRMPTDMLLPPDSPATLSLMPTR